MRILVCFCLDVCLAVRLAGVVYLWAGVGCLWVFDLWFSGLCGLRGAAVICLDLMLLTSDVGCLLIVVVLVSLCF